MSGYTMRLPSIRPILNETASARVMTRSCGNGGESGSAACTRKTKSGVKAATRVTAETRRHREIIQDRSRLRTFWKIESLFLKSDELFMLVCDATFDENAVPSWTRGDFRGVLERLSLPQRERRLGSASRSLCVSVSLRLS